MNRIGEVYINNQGCYYKIIEYKGRNNITILFENGYVSKNIQIGNINTGNVKNPYFPSVVGVGYLGGGKYNPKDFPLIYDVWTNVLYRGYSEKIKEKYPTYKDCSVDECWHCFQDFGNWFEYNWKPHMEGWHLDKDILVKGNKIYSPETCCFVPPQINSLFCKATRARGRFPIGVRKENKKFLAFMMKNKLQLRLGLFNTIEEAFKAYKITKEAHIKEKAEEWKDKVEDKVYQAMCNWVVEITD
jgi:hypothetical protein